MRRITAARSEISIFESLEKLKLQQERFFALFNRLKNTENILIIETENSDENAVFDKIVNKITPLCLV
jgi:hypothetical protein